MELVTLNGTIHKIMPFEKKSDKFSKQEFILKMQNQTPFGTYVEYIRLQCINDKIHLLSGAEPKDMASVRYRLSGRKFGNEPEETYFTNLIVEELNVLSKHDDGPIDIKVGDTNDYSDLLPDMDQDESEKKSDIPPEYDDLPF